MQETTRMTLYIADKQQNRLMKAFDLCPDHKVYVTGKQRVSFKTKLLVDETYIQQMIEKSRSNADFWIPAIEHDGVLHTAPELMELSDGNKVAFVGKAAA